jgi:hypothetical protein
MSALDSNAADHFSPESARVCGFKLKNGERISPELSNHELLFIDVGNRQYTRWRQIKKRQSKPSPPSPQAASTHALQREAPMTASHMP